MERKSSHASTFGSAMWHGINRTGSHLVRISAFKCHGSYRKSCKLKIVMRVYAAHRRSMHLHVYIWPHICIHVYTYLYIHMYMYICICIYVYVD